MPIVVLVADQPGVRAATVATRRPDVYPDCAAEDIASSWRRDAA